MKTTPEQRAAWRAAAAAGEFFAADNVALLLDDLAAACREIAFLRTLVDVGEIRQTALNTQPETNGGPEEA